MSDQKNGGGLAQGSLGDLFANLPIRENDSDHFEALGRFVVQYASAEAALHTLARHLSGLPDAKARIIFSGMRLSDIVERARKMLAMGSLGTELDSDIENCLVHLDAISKRRHNIVHRSVRYDAAEDVLQVSNMFTAKSVIATEQEIYKKEDLQNMRRDCQRIFLRLINATGVYEDVTKEELESWRGPWWYKPPQLAQTKKPLRKVPPKQKRQRRASVEKS